MREQELQTENSNFRKQIVVLGREQEESRAALERERESQRALVERERELAQHKVSELEKALASEQRERYQEREREREMSKITIRKLEEKSEMAQVTICQLEEKVRLVCELDKPEMQQELRQRLGDGKGHVRLLDDKIMEENAIMEAQKALVECQIADLERQLQKRDKKIAHLTREVEALEIVKNGKQLTDCQAEVVRLQKANEELRNANAELQKNCFEASVNAAREENTKQKMCNELVALRARRKELLKSLHAAHAHAIHLTALTADALLECKNVHHEMTKIMLYECKPMLFQAAAKVMLDLSYAESNLCHAVTQTTQNTETRQLQATHLKEEAEARQRELESPFKGLDSTVEWLEGEKKAVEETCKDLERMCVAYREQIANMQNTIKEHACELAARDKSLAAKENEIELRDAELEKMQVEIETQKRVFQKEIEALDKEQTRQLLNPIHATHSQGVCIIADKPTVPHVDGMWGESESVGKCDAITQTSEIAEAQTNGVHRVAAGLLRQKAAEETCKDLERMCVAYREQIARLQNTINEHEEETKALKALVNDQIARIDILGAEHTFQDQLRRDLMAKVKDLEAQPKVKGPEAQKHEIAKERGLSSSMKGLGLGSNLDFEFESPMHTSVLGGTEAGGAVLLEVAQALQEGRDKLRGIRTHALELEASHSRLSNEVQNARKRIAQVLSLLALQVHKYKN
jgi:chromosome segregation ATPase